MRCTITFKNFSIPQQRKIRIVGLYFLFFFVITGQIFAQDSIPIAKDLTEEKELEFQQFFFKALSEKSIGNYQNAIQYLENCNQILPDNPSVFFEFSKNYLSLEEYLQAKEYISRAIQKEPENIWLLKHLVAVLDKQRNYGEAIEVQKKIVTLHRKEKEGLADLYIKNRDYQTAFHLIQQIESEGRLSPKLKYFKEFYNKRNNGLKKQEIATDVTSLIDKFESEKSYETLNQLLSKLSSEDEKLKYINKGLQLFPIQATLYLRKGEILFAKKQYKSVIEVLENGIDFVLDDGMMKKFYEILYKSNNAIGNKEKGQKYKSKYDKI